MLGTYHLNALFDILNKLHFVYEPQELWQFVIEQACKTIQAESGTYFQLSENEEALEPVCSFGIDISRLRKVSFKVGHGVAGWVAQFHQPALVADVRTDNRFNRQIDHVLGYQTKMILCVPVFSQKRNYGVLETLNRKSGQFSPQDQEFLTLLGRQAAVAYQNLLLLDEAARTRAWLESLMRSLSGGLVAIDPKNKIAVLNPSAAGILGLPVADYTGKPADVILIDFPWIRETLSQLLAQPAHLSRQETVLRIQNQDVRLGYSTIPIQNAEGKSLGAGLIFQRL